MGIRAMLDHAAWILMLALGLAFSSGCAASARFYSKSGRSFVKATDQAVLCTEMEIRAVVAAGGEPIGTVAAKGMRDDANQLDVEVQAAKVAARNGGTHVVLTAKGVEYFTTATPAVVQAECVEGRDDVHCTTVATASTERTIARPTASYLVFRVPPEHWQTLLPPPLRPGRVGQ